MKPYLGAKTGPLLRNEYPKQVTVKLSGAAWGHCKREYWHYLDSNTNVGISYFKMYQSWPKGGMCMIAVRNIWYGNIPVTVFRVLMFQVPYISLNPPTTLQHLYLYYDFHFIHEHTEVWRI